MPKKPNNDVYKAVNKLRGRKTVKYGYFSNYERFKSNNSLHSINLRII